MENTVSSIYKDFLKKCSKVTDPISQFEILSLLCKNSSLQMGPISSQAYDNIFQTLALNESNSFDVSEDLPVFVLKKVIEILVCYYQVKSLGNSEYNDAVLNDKVFSSVSRYILSLVEFQSKQENYALFLVKALNKYLKIFATKTPEFLQQLQAYFNISTIVSSLTSHQELTEHDYTTQAAQALEKKYQILFTLYSEGVRALHKNPSRLKLLQEQYSNISYLYLWCYGIKNEGQNNNQEEIQFKASNFIYGAEGFLNFFRRNLISALVDIYRLLTSSEGFEYSFGLLKMLLKLFRTNFEYYERQENKYIEDEIFRPKSLDHVRLMMHIYTAWPQENKEKIFYKENDFFWVCLERALLVEDPQAKKIALQLLENVISDEKELLKRSKLPDMKKYVSVYDKVWNSFLDLYKTLENYAVHLVKAIFSSIDHLVKELEAKTLQELGSILHNQNDMVFYKAKWLLSILLKKATNHKNTSITRYFIKGFLKLPLNIEEMQEFVYSDLIEILNIGMFYRDAADLQADSRFFKIISNFFTVYYNKLPLDMLKQHIRKFLIAIKTHAKFQNAVISLLLVFQDMNSREIFIEKEDLAVLVSIVKENVGGLNLRKQHQMFQAVMSLLLLNSSTENIDLSDILKVFDCFPIEFLEMVYKPAEIKEIVLRTMFVQNTEDVDIIIQELLAQDFSFNYKLFVWLFTRFDLMKIYNELTAKLFEFFKNVQNSSTEEFTSILKVLRALSIAYEVTESKTFPTESLFNTAFLQEKVNKDVNAVINELLNPFQVLLNTIYRNTYLPENACLQLLKHLQSFLEIFSNQRDSRTFVTLIRFVDHVFSEVIAYILLLLNKELSSEEEPSHAIDTQLGSLIKHILTISSQSQFVAVKCTLLSLSSKFIQDFMGIFKGYLNGATLEPTKLASLLLIFNSMLDCYNREILLSAHSGKNFFIESELFNSALYFLSSIKQISFKSGFTRSFEDLRQKFLVNYFLLISYDQNITGSVEYKELTENIVQNAQDVVDAHDIRNAGNLFGLLKVLYIPSLISRFRTEDSDEKDSLMREYKGIFERGIRSLLQSEFYTFTEVKSFVEFIFDERVLIDANLRTREEIKECMFELMKESERKQLFQRIFVNHFVKVLLKNPTSASHYIWIFEKLLVQKEYRGFEAEIYDKMINEKKDEENDLLSLIPTVASYYGAYTRLYTLVYLEQFVTILEEKVAKALEKEVTEEEKSEILSLKTFVETFSTILLDYNIKGRPGDVVMPYSEPHRKKVHLSQALCVIMRAFNKEIYYGLYKEKLGFEINHLDYLENIIWKILEYNNLPSVRQYHEIFVLHMLRNFPERVIPNLESYLKSKTNKTQILVSIVWLSGYYINSNPTDPTAERLFVYFFPYVASNTAYVRAIGQYFSVEYLKKKGAENIDHPVIKEFYDNFIQLDKKLNMCKQFDKTIIAFEQILNNFDIKTLLTTPFDEFGEILHDSVTEKLKNECIEMMALVKQDDAPPPKKEELWQLYLSLHAKEANEILKAPEEEGVANFQKKIEIDEELYPNDLLINTKQLRTNDSEKMDIIVVATLLEKVPNFANLTRTCEIFSVAQLVVPNIKIMEDEGFKAIAVTAERWLNMIEVKENQLAEYLQYKKMCGYTLVGLEQTRASTSLEKFKFPNKCVLLLGNERQGTPMKYIEMMDSFIEIPQYGIVRSLNVHISAVICIWECVKQKKGLKSE